MKKLIYIILVAVLLFFAGKYVRDKQLENLQKSTPTNEITIVENNSDSSDAQPTDTNASDSSDVVDPVTGEVVGASDSNIVDTTDYDDNSDGQVVEDNDDANDNPGFVEENPEVTQGDDETIVAE